MPRAGQATCRPRRAAATGQAISKNKKRPEAYSGLAKVYVVQDDLTSAEDIFLTALSNQPKNVDLYKACFQFYLDTKQPMGIPELLADANEKVVNSLSEEEKIGGKIVLKALEEPAKQIAVNAGLEPAVIVEKVKQSEKGIGFNAANNTYVSRFEKLADSSKPKQDTKFKKKKKKDEETSYKVSNKELEKFWCNFIHI